MPNSAPILATIGTGYINLDRTSEAVRPLRRAAQLIPNAFLVQAQLGFALYATGQTDSAIATLRKATT